MGVEGTYRGERVLPFSFHLYTYVFIKTHKDLSQAKFPTQLFQIFVTGVGVDVWEEWASESRVWISKGTAGDITALTRWEVEGKKSARRLFPPLNTRDLLSLLNHSPPPPPAPRPGQQGAG